MEVEVEEEGWGGGCCLDDVIEGEEGRGGMGLGRERERFWRVDNEEEGGKGWCWWWVRSCLRRWCWEAMQRHVYKTLRLLKQLYPHNVDPCSIKQVMPDHCSLRLLTLSLLIGDFPQMERQLCVSAGCFAFR